MKTPAPSNALPVTDKLDFHDAFHPCTLWEAVATPDEASFTPYRRITCDLCRTFRVNRETITSCHLIASVEQGCIMCRIFYTSIQAFAASLRSEYYKSMILDFSLNYRIELKSLSELWVWVDSNEKFRIDIYTLNGELRVQIISCFGWTLIRTLSNLCR